MAVTRWYLPAMIQQCGVSERLPAWDEGSRMIDLVFRAPAMTGGALAGASSGMLGTFIVGMRIPFLGVCVAHAACFLRIDSSVLAPKPGRCRILGERSAEEARRCLLGFGTRFPLNNPNPDRSRCGERRGAFLVRPPPTGPRCALPGERR